MTQVIDSRHPVAYAALEKFIKEIAWTAAAMMQDRLKEPDKYAGDGIFEATPLAVAKFMLCYALEEDTSLCDALVTELANIPHESAVTDV